MKVDLEAVSIILCLAALFGVGTLISHEFSLRAFALGGLGGGFIGFAGLPYFDEKKWKARPLICAVLAALFSSGVTLYQGHSLAAVALLGVVGFIIGFFAPRWAKYI